MIARTAGALALIAASASASYANQLSGDELRDIFSGRTINLSAPFGSLPIRYSSGGTMTAQSRAMQLFSGYYRDTGSWRISGNRMCQRWSIWNGGNEQCFTVTRKGTTLYWSSNDGMTGTAYAAN